MSSTANFRNLPTGVRPEAHQRRLPVHSCGRARRRAPSAAAERAVYCFARVSAAAGMRRQDYFRQGLRGWLRLHEKGGRRHDVPAHHRAERHRPLRTGRRGVRAHQPRRLDYRRDAGIRRDSFFGEDA